MTTRVEMHRGADAVVADRCRQLFDHVTATPDRRSAGPATGFTAERTETGVYEARPHADLHHP